MVQAGAVRLTTIAALLEWQRDWKNREHYDALMTLIKQHAGAYGAGVEYCYTLVHKAPQSAKKPHVVAKGRGPKSFRSKTASDHTRLNSLKTS
jgi:hypothetical protein